MYQKFLVLFSAIFILFSMNSFAEEPTSRAEQCEAYGSYQDADGNWQTCSEDDSPTEEESE